ncbi:hypothetical protein GCM10010264_60840 [Streptomyces globisporus]|nr:hypothetical protein GCM10010264_60840 [Streptomyces globisporus]
MERSERRVICHQRKGFSGFPSPGFTRRSIRRSFQLNPMVTPSLIVTNTVCYFNLPIQTNTLY